LPIPIPLPGVPGSGSDEDIAANPPPQAKLFIEPVGQMAEELGGVAKIRGLADNQQDQETSRWLTAVANVAYQRQRNLSALKGGTPFTVRSGHIPIKVAAHYTSNLSSQGALKDLQANNGNKPFNNSTWNVGKTWLLPLNWEAEAKSIPPQLTASAKTVKIPSAARRAKKPPSNTEPSV